VKEYKSRQLVGADAQGLRSGEFVFFEMMNRWNLEILKKKCIFASTT
jgi:hypothetical protein